LTLAQARNAAARETNAEWLCFLDADDELESGYLEAMDDAWTRLRPRATEPLINPPLLAPALRRVWSNDLRSSTRAEIPNRGRWPQINECVIGTLVQAAMFRAVGGFRDFTDDGERILMYEDWHLWLRCWNSGAQIVHVDEAVYREHVNDKGRNTNAHLAIQVYDAIWRDHERDLAVLRGES
jgi:glycosyltransferase involved in cell wall biosynthesis